LADPEAHIRELQKRVEREPGSRFFVPLADELRKAGRLAEAIATLEAGLAVHTGYVAARIALARAYLEAGRIENSMASFSRALIDDPSNLVAAKALGDLHLSRGEPLEALKRYRLFRAISGDRRLDGVIDRLNGETSQASDVVELAPPEAPPPPSSGALEPAEPYALPPELAQPFPTMPPGVAGAHRHTDPFDISGITYKRPTRPAPLSTEGEPEILSRDFSLDALAASPPGREDVEVATRKLQLPVTMWPFEPEAPPAPPEEPKSDAPALEVAPSRPEEPSDAPSGRTLADLYFEQGHYAEALRLYGELLSADESNEEIRTLCEEAKRLAAAALPPDLPAGDPGRDRRLARIRVLNEWLDVIRNSSR
jgi:tetratricopeptide (TPR) repeat protein